MSSRCGISGYEYFTCANKLFCIDYHGIEVPSESEQKEPAEINTLFSRLQSPPNISSDSLKLHGCNCLWRRMTDASLSFS